MKRPSLTLVINTSGRLDCLPFSFGAISRETRGRDGVEFVLVDNSPDGRVAPLFREWQDRLPAARYERETVLGMIPARNAGIRAARHEVIAYVDDDALVRPGWLDGLLSTYERFWDGSAPIVVGGPVTLQYPDGVQRPDWLSPTMENWLTRLDLGNQDRVLDHPAECLVGANFSAPRSTFARCGGFVDLGLKYGSDERLIEHVVLEAGGSVVYAARAHADHMVGAARLTPEWFRNRYRAEGLSRQRMLQYLHPRSRPSLAFRAAAFTAKMMMARFGRILAQDPALRLEAECRACYARGCVESTWHLLTASGTNRTRAIAAA